MAKNDFLQALEGVTADDLAEVRKQIDETEKKLDGLRAAEKLIAIRLNGKPPRAAKPVGQGGDALSLDERWRKVAVYVIAGGVYRFRDSTHPLVTGSTPEEGENCYTIKIPMELGETLVLELGRPGIAVLMAWCSVVIGEDEPLWNDVDRIAEDLVRKDGE